MQTLPKTRGECLLFFVKFIKFSKIQIHTLRVYSTLKNPKFKYTIEIPASKVHLTLKIHTLIVYSPKCPFPISHLSCTYLIAVKWNFRTSTSSQYTKQTPPKIMRCLPKSIDNYLYSYLIII